MILNRFLLCRSFFPIARPRLFPGYRLSAQAFASTITSGSRPGQSKINREIGDLVPNKGVVSVIDSSGKFKKNINLKRFLAESNLTKGNQKLVVVNYEPSADVGVDARVVCKVVSAKETPPDGPTSRTKKSYGEKKQTSKNTAQQIKPVEISWTIGDKDLRGQKRLAIESILVKKRHRLELKLAAKKYTRRSELNALQLEQRELLVEKCLEIAGHYGVLVSRDGDIHGDVTLTYAPHK